MVFSGERKTEIRERVLIIFNYYTAIYKFMNLQQLEYIIALDNLRHFVQAADQCCVTQPTLSMMIKKLEEELDVKIFDRTKQPIAPTDIGRLVIDQARTVLRETARMQELVKQFNGVMSGELRLAVIPTISPYLLPNIVRPFITKYPDVSLQVSEMVTDRIYSGLKSGVVDVGIVATTSSENTFLEIPLYRERFYAFVSESSDLFGKEFILPDDILPDDLWLLEEGHCLSGQIRKLCELRPSQLINSFQFRSGSIETLIKMVEINGGVTILPELAVRELTAERKKHLRLFKEPVPAREVMLVVNREQIKTRLIDALKSEIDSQFGSKGVQEVATWVV